MYGNLLVGDDIVSKVGSDFSGVLESGSREAVAGNFVNIICSRC